MGRIDVRAFENGKPIGSAVARRRRREFLSSTRRGCARAQTSSDGTCATPSSAFLNLPPISRREFSDSTAGGSALVGFGCGIRRPTLS